MKKQPTFTGWTIIFVIAFAIAFPAIKYFDRIFPQTLNGDGMYLLSGMIVFLICFALVYKLTQVIKEKIINHG